MDRKKIIYIGVLLIITVLVSVLCFSYAFFTEKSEQRGKLNIVAGTLNYRIDSNNLVNNAITLASGESKTIQLKITSLNNIDSKYKLYYTATSQNVTISYDDNYDVPEGTIVFNGSKKLSITLKNKSTSSNTITFGVQGGFINNTLALDTGNNAITLVTTDTPTYESGYVWDFSFDPDEDGAGQEQTFDPPVSGKYKLEVWGAQGGTYSETKYGGYGGYAVGVAELTENNTLYLNVGGAGILVDAIGNNEANAPGGYNGGGAVRIVYSNDKTQRYGGSGGGATHIALTSGLLQNLESYKGTLSANEDYYISDTILIVAGGGGGVGGASSFSSGGSGGGMSGKDSPCTGTGGTQISPGTCTSSTKSISGTFGAGASSPLEGNSIGGSGGGGFYGGAKRYDSSTSAGGGSGYIASSNLSSLIGVTKHMTCFSCTTSPESATETYTISNTCHNTEATVDCSKEGNGYARITYLGE